MSDDLREAVTLLKESTALLRRPGESFANFAIARFEGWSEKVILGLSRTSLYFCDEKGGRATRLYFSGIKSCQLDESRRRSFLLTLVSGQVISCSLETESDLPTLLWALSNELPVYERVVSLSHSDVPNVRVRSYVSKIESKVKTRYSLGGDPDGIEIDGNRADEVVAEVKRVEAEEWGKHGPRAEEG